MSGDPERNQKLLERLVAPNCINILTWKLTTCLLSGMKTATLLAG